MASAVPWEFLHWGVDWIRNYRSVGKQVAAACDQGYLYTVLECRRAPQKFNTGSKSIWSRIWIFCSKVFCWQFHKIEIYLHVLACCSSLPDITIVRNHRVVSLQFPLIIVTPTYPNMLINLKLNFRNDWISFWIVTLHTSVLYSCVASQLTELWHSEEQDKINGGLLLRRKGGSINYVYLAQERTIKGIRQMKSILDIGYWLASLISFTIEQFCKKYRIVASRSTSRLVTPHVTNQLNSISNMAVKK